jgi:tetratricopeptide (TPR) repeat protein
LALAVVLSSSPSRADKILDKPSFTASPKELLSLSANKPSTHAAVIIREEEESIIDAQNRNIYRLRRIFVVTTQAGVDDWGTFSWSWKPFHQDKPVFRARVIDPNGAITELDQKLVTDAPEKSSPNMFSDRRMLEAPLPRLRIGAVVEEEIVIKDRQPILSGGAFTLSAIGADVPVESTRITISTPAHKGKLFTSNLPAKTAPKYTIAGARETWTYELGPQAPTAPGERYVPRDVGGPGLIGVSTATWQELAREYRKLLDKRIADGAFSMPSGLPTAPTLETVKAISAWLHRNVRYTGIEFDEASHIPWTPAETAKRGFGDCKDKATLLVALLRQAGITADLALLQTGPGFDVVPQLAGVSVFDHAIVRARISGRDVWIDATEDLLVPGQLPTRDQGRRALVIADSTTGLVDTPRAVATDNVVREVRTFELAESDRAKRLVEASTLTGVFDAYEREWIRGSNGDDIKKNLERYLDSEYSAKLITYTSTPPEDVTKPFSITVEATDVGRAYTDRGRIDVYLYATDTLEKVPAIAKEPDKQPRKYDFEWYTPHVYEIENRLVLPPGYTMPSVAAERVHTLGPARIIERQRVDGRTLVITFRFESGKQRITPAELEAMQKEIAALGDATHVVIEHTAWSLADRGKLKEAVAEMDKLIALHPKEAVHRGQQAYILIRAGMGEAARRAAREAVKLEPRNADAYAVLGWTLRHDTLGREFTHDFDRAGAIAAFEKARKLNPKHVGAATGHAEVLERDATGTRFGKGADLKAAADAWRAALKLEDTDENAFSVARASLWSGQFAEVEAILSKRKSSDMRDALIVAALAARTSPADAVALAGRMRAGTARTTLVTTAAQLLVMLGHYDAGRALLADTNVLSSGSPMGVLLLKVKRHDSKAIPEHDPRKPLEDIYGSVVDETRRTRFIWDAQTEEEQGASKAAREPQLAMLRGIGTRFLEDALHSVVETRVEGKGPWRVEVDALGQRAVYYAALDGKVAKLIGSGERPAGAGRHVFRLLARNDTAGAAALLDLVAKDATEHWAIKDWSASKRDKEAIELAAAMLVNTTDTARSTPVLTRCASATGERRERCDSMLAGAYYKDKKWRELDKHASEWLKRSADSKEAKVMRISALTKLGRFDEAEKAVADAKQPDDTRMVMAHAEIAIARGALDNALTIYERIAARDPLVQNDVAWMHVVLDKDLDRGLEIAAKVVGPNKEKARFPQLNTLAVIEAELGRLDAAKEDLWKSIEARREIKPEVADWYIIGRIAEHLGLREDAIAAYKKCTQTPSDDPRSFFAFAKRRLQRMGVK